MQILACTVLASSYKTYDLHENAKILPECNCKITRYYLNSAYQKKSVFMKADTESILRWHAKFDYFIVYMLLRARI
jgi:hypothetical protein